MAHHEGGGRGGGGGQQLTCPPALPICQVSEGHRGGGERRRVQNGGPRRGDVEAGAGRHPGPRCIYRRGHRGGEGVLPPCRVRGGGGRGSGGDLGTWTSGQRPPVRGCTARPRTAAPGTWTTAERMSSRQSGQDPHPPAQPAEDGSPLGRPWGTQHSGWQRPWTLAQPPRVSLERASCSPAWARKSHGLEVRVETRAPHGPPPGRAGERVPPRQALTAKSGPSIKDGPGGGRPARSYGRPLSVISVRTRMHERPGGCPARMTALCNLLCHFNSQARARGSEGRGRTAARSARPCAVSKAL